MSEEAAYRRYVQVNLPHSRTIIQRIWRTLDALGALSERGDGEGTGLQLALGALEEQAQPFEDDPPLAEALTAADLIADRARTVVSSILEGETRSDRLGQHVRNLFECLGLADEGAHLSLECGEIPDSPLR